MNVLTRALAAGAILISVAACATDEGAPAGGALDESALTPAAPVVVDATPIAGGDSAASSNQGPAGAAVVAGTAPAVGAGAGAAGGGTRVFVIDPAQSQASYEAKEEFLQGAVERLGVALGDTMAVGTTGSVSGTIEADPASAVVHGGTIEVDISTLKSDRDRRDQALRERWLESQVFPKAVFEITGVEGAPSSYTEGEEVSFQLVGNLTVRDRTVPTTWDVTARLEGDTITGTATTTVSTLDFGFDPPDMSGFLTVEDGILLKIALVATEM